MSDNDLVPRARFYAVGSVVMGVLLLLVWWRRGGWWVVPVAAWYFYIAFGCFRFVWPNRKPKPLGKDNE